MPRTIPALLTTALVSSTLGACAGLPITDTDKTAKTIETVDAGSAAKTPYVDYWQTRDPSENRRAATDSEDRKPVAPSRDIKVVAQGGKQEAKTPDSAGKAKTGNAAAAPTPQKPAVAATAKPNAHPPAITVTLRTADKATPVATQTTDKPVPVATKTANKPADQTAEKTRIALAQPTARKPGPHPKGKAGPVAKPDLWSRMRGRMALTDVQNPRIDEQIEYIKRNPAYLALLSQRARPFLYYIMEHVDRRGLPMDLALLPMVESAFEPTAVSPKEAAGLWQIIPGTGQERGLVLSDGYDGRFDIHTSTITALGYLEDLNKMFDGDWLLALAAYNAGPGTVQDALDALKASQARAAAAAAKSTANAKSAAPAAAGDVAANTKSAAPATAGDVAANTKSAASAGEAAATPAAIAATSPAQSDATTPDPAPPAPPPSPYWDLKLPKETQDYIPRIVALARIIANPDAYGVRLPSIDDHAYLYRVDLVPENKIYDVLATTAIPVEEFLRFNPAFKPGIEPPARAYNLLLPQEQAKTLLANAPGARLVAPSKYTVRKGETLDGIAKRYGVPSRLLAQWNGLNARVALKAGQQLIVYPAS